jgi:sec-independent protein translocase protein TatB
MFDVGWSEILVIAVVLIVVVGPKDLPRMLRSFGRTTAKLRVMAGDFRRQFDEALREAELGDVKDTLDSVRSLNPMNEIRKHLSPLEQAGEEVRAGLEDVMKPMAKPEASTEPVAEEPLKNGTAALPGEGGEMAGVAPKAKTVRKTKAPVAKAGAKGSGVGANGAASGSAARSGTARSRAVSVKKAASSSPAPAAKAVEVKPAAKAKSRAAVKAEPEAAPKTSAAPKVRAGARAKAPARPAAKKPAAKKKTTGNAP